MGISELKKKVEAFPAFGNVPLLFVGGKYITPKEAIELYDRGMYVDEIDAELRRLKIDPDYKILAEEYFKRLAKERPELKIVMMGKIISVQEALEHIKKEDEIGKILIEAHKKVLEEVARI